MKKLKRLITILALLMVTIAFVSCSKPETTKPKTTPEEATKIYLDIIFKNDNSNKDKLGLSDADYDALRNEIETELIGEFSKLNTEGISISEEVKNNFKKDFLEGLSKLEYEVLPKSSEKDHARVEIKIKGFDYNKIITDSTEKVKEQYSANMSMTEEELTNLSFKTVGSYLANGTLSQTVTSLEFYLTLEDNIWVPLDSDFIALGKATFSM